MARVFQPRITRYVEHRGRRVKKSTPGARKAKPEKAKKWYGEFRDSSGKLQRVPLCRDKVAAQIKLAELILRSEKQQAGLIDRYDEHHRTPLAHHVTDFENHLRNRDNTDKYVLEVAGKVRRIVTGCRFSRIPDLSASAVESYLASLRRDGMSSQTSNHYLRAIKQFSRWLVNYDRTGEDVLIRLSMLSVDHDRRHDRRPLSDDEFARLIKAAISGPTVEALPSPDRAMVYILAAWTGYRRAELASLTKRSFKLRSNPPSLAVPASHTNNRKAAEIPLHADVVERYLAWIDEKGEMEADSPVFQLKTTGGHWRKTAKMMRLDLKAAREAWQLEAKTAEDREKREESDFLCYRDEDGLYADFHANRHTFVTNLRKAGVPLTARKKLARHLNTSLTENTYDHYGIDEKAEAIAALAPPPKAGVASDADNQGEQPDAASVAMPYTCLVSAMVVGPGVHGCHQVSADDPTPPSEGYATDERNSLAETSLDCYCQLLTGVDQVHPTGFEPVTFGSVDRCSIQLS